MPVEDKDKKEFEFIKEQVVENKRKKIKKMLKPFLKTFLMAVLFGSVAAVTFCVVEPRLYKYLNKQEDRKSITFPNDYPDEDNDNKDQDAKPDGDESLPSDSNEDDDKRIIVEKVDAKIDDFISIYNDIYAVASETSKAIVKIDSVVDGQDLFGNPAEIRHSTSGLVIADVNKELAILVSYDRINDANRIQLVFSGHSMVDAKLLSFDKEINLAVLKVMVEDIPPMHYNSIEVAELGESNSVTMGMPVMALGNPNGYYESMIIGHVTNKLDYASIVDNQVEVFNTNIVENENADGVIVNLKGQIIGFITRTLKDDDNENVNTVMGISKLKPIIQQMANEEARVYMGIIAGDLSEDVKDKYDVKAGVYIKETISDSPAFEAGLKSGDIIMSIEEQEVFGVNSFHSILNEYEPEEEINVKVKRTSAHNKELEFKIALGRKK